MSRVVKWWSGRWWSESKNTSAETSDFSCVAFGEVKKGARLPRGLNRRKYVKFVWLKLILVSEVKESAETQVCGFPKPVTALLTWQDTIFWSRKVIDLCQDHFRRKDRCSKRKMLQKRLFVGMPGIRKAAKEKTSE